MAHERDGEFSTEAKNEVLLFARTQMDLEIIIVPSDIRQARKDKYHVTSLICETRELVS